MNNTYADYAQTVSRPGKFEGESPYVPYLWEQDLEWDGDSDIGNVARVEIEEEDIAIFPELVGKTVVYLHESSDGFVSEITERGYELELARIEQFYDSQAYYWGGDDDTEDDSHDE